MFFAPLPDSPIMDNILDDMVFHRAWTSTEPIAAGQILNQVDALISRSGP